MLRVTLVEQPAPTGMQDADHLLAWLLDSLGLVRRRNEVDSAAASSRPLHRLMRDHLLAGRGEGKDAKRLASELGISLTALHHHLGALHSCRLVTSVSGSEGWQLHHLRGNSLSAALELLRCEAIAVLKLRLSLLTAEQSGSLEAIEEGEEAAIPLKISIIEPHPLASGQDHIDSLLNDLGLRGDRPQVTAGEDLTRQVFEALLVADHPLSLDESLMKWEVTRPRLTRTFERFRQAGLATRCQRTDRLPVILWDALTSQYARRGEDWLMGKGGLGRLDEKLAKRVVESLAGGKFTTERCAELFASVALSEKMLTINLLGGRLPYGYQLCGTSGEEVVARVIERVNSLFLRMGRVAERLEELISVD